MQRQFTHHGAVITLRRRTNGDLIDAELITNLLMDGADPAQKRAWVRRYLQARNYAATLVSITHVEGDPGFVLPSIDAPEEDIRAAFDAWLADDSGFYTVWNSAMLLVNAPPGDIDTSPAADPKEAAATK